MIFNDYGTCSGVLLLVVFNRMFIAKTIFIWNHHKRYPSSTCNVHRAIRHLNSCYKWCDISCLSFSDFKEKEVASEQYRDDQACKELWLKTLQMVKLIWSIVLVFIKMVYVMNGCVWFRSFIIKYEKLSPLQSFFVYTWLTLYLVQFDCVRWIEFSINKSEIAWCVKESSL